MNGRFTAFRNVTLLSMDTPELQLAQTVLISDGKIVEIGPADQVSLPETTEIIEGQGRYLMPGLADMHVHLFMSGGVGEDISNEITAEEKIELLGYLAIGVTTVREMSGSPGRLKMRDAQRASAVVGPRLIISSPILEGEEAVWPASPKLTTPADAHRKVLELAEAGYDFIKVYHTLSAPVYRSVLAAAREAKLRVTGHVPFQVGIESAIAGGQFCIEHLRGYDFDGLTSAELAEDGGRSPWRLRSWTRMTRDRRRSLAFDTGAAGIWNVPTLIVQRFLGDAEYRQAAATQPQFALLPVHCQESLTDSIFDQIYSLAAKQAIQDAYPAQLAFVAELHRAGSNLLIGSDTPVGFLSPGFTAIDEMREFARCGIPNFDILKMATVNVQKMLHGDAAAGVVKVGNVLDLILLNSDPLHDIRNLWDLDGVYAGGVWRRRAELLQDIRKLRQTTSNLPTGRRIAGCACCH